MEQQGIKNIVGEDIIKSKKISDIFKEVTRDIVAMKDENLKVVTIKHNGKTYEMECRKIDVQNAFSTTKVIDIDKKKSILSYSIYLILQMLLSLKSKMKNKRWLPVLFISTIMKKRLKA